jgi:N-acetylneuraminic acid mutarotase
MKKIAIILFLITGMNNQINAQYAWTQVDSLGGMNRQAAVGFAIGDYGYIALGLNYETQLVLNDLWQYDPISNTWTQKADFPGISRVSAVSFVIGNIGYIGSGSSNYPASFFTNEFWEYNPISNTWSSIAPFPGTSRYCGTSFSIGMNGYFGCGWHGSFYNDFWEYNSINNTWLSIANYPGNPSIPTSFSDGRFGYVGAGEDNTNLYSNFWKYDTLNNSWSPIANLPMPSYEPTSFVLLGKGYVGTGSSSFSFSDLYSHWWCYDTTTNIWMVIPEMTGVPRLSAVAFSIGNAGYCGTGAITDYTHDLNDFNKYYPTDVGINELSGLISNISIYPNPSDGIFRINYSSSRIASVDIKVINMTGKIIAMVNRKQTIGANEFSLDLSNKARGVYFIELISDTNHLTKKIVLE